jgi:hypothetical protein
MRRVTSDQMTFICLVPSRGAVYAGPSGKEGKEKSRIPDFVEAAVALNVPRPAAEALRRQVAKAYRDIRERRITPIGGQRRVDRVALAVAEALYSCGAIPVGEA